MQMWMRMSMGSILSVRKGLDYRSLGLMVDRGIRFASSSSLSPNLSPEAPEFPFGIDGPSPAPAAAATPTVLDHQLLIVPSSSPEPTVDNRLRLDQQLQHR